MIATRQVKFELMKMKFISVLKYECVFVSVYSESPLIYRRD